MGKCIMCGKSSIPHDVFCEEHKEEFDNQYCKDVSSAYWAEMAEIEAGIHPSQTEN